MLHPSEHKIYSIINNNMVFLLMKKTIAKPHIHACVLIPFHHMKTDAPHQCINLLQYVKKGNLFEKGNLTFQQGAYCRMIRIQLSLCFWGGAPLRRCVCRALVRG